MTSAVLSLGSNLGDRLGRLRAAAAGLGDALLVSSEVYETPPWGDTDQPDYLNASVLVAEAEEDPLYWLGVAQRLEREAGRVRDPARRFGPRSLDVDVIMVFASDGAPITRTDPRFTVPHPRAHLRAFVLRPWLDIQPYAELPGRGRVRDLLRSEPIVTDLRSLRSCDGVTLEMP